jgi:8-oxo-dGTP diphosphatase
VEVLFAVSIDSATPQVIVGAAIVEGGRVLACARADQGAAVPRWEFPGGKLEHGESEVEALLREIDEELGVRVEVGRRIGGDVPVRGDWALLRVYLARLADGEVPQPLEHEELRWLGPDELDSVDWMPADAPIVEALRPLLRGT